MSDSFLAVCENFRSQSKICQQMGSPFYAQLLSELAELISQNRENHVGDTFAAWPGTAKQDAVALSFGPELDIFEIGASAGLNMAFDQHFYQTESWQWGDPGSNLSFKPNWSGNAPPLGPLKIQQRSACDLSPIDLASQKDRLLSYL
jgi:hypothetical protein